MSVDVPSSYSRCTWAADWVSERWKEGDDEGRVVMKMKN